MKRFVNNIMTKGILWSVLVVMPIAPAQAQEEAAKKPPAVLVEVKQASSALMAPEVMMPGTIVSLNDSRIAAQISGLVKWVASEGTLVEEGDVIATIEDSDFTLMVGRSEAQVSRLESRVTYLTSQLKRYQELAATNSAPASQLDEATSNLAMTNQDLVQARINLKQAFLSLSRTKVRAPFPGRVVSRLAQAGEYSSPGRQLLRLVDVAHLEIKAQAPVALAPLLTDGQSVSLQSGDDRMETNIRSLIPVGDDISRTMEIRVKVPEGNWVVGSAVQVALPSSAPSEVVAVHRDALILRLDGTYIFRLKEDNTAERLKITTGAAKGSQIAVVGDLQHGDRVVVRGGERLRPGQEVRLTRTEAEAAGR